MPPGQSPTGFLRTVPVKSNGPSPGGLCPGSPDALQHPRHGQSELIPDSGPPSDGMIGWLMITVPGG